MSQQPKRKAARKQTLAMVGQSRLTGMFSPSSTAFESAGSQTAGGMDPGQEQQQQQQPQQQEQQEQQQQ